MLRPALAIAIAPLLLTMTAPTAFAQARDPAYAEARDKGLVGEKVDGYLGFVVPPSPELRKVIEDINIRRRAVYAERAKTNNATIEEYALTMGCGLIAHTSPGEKYQAPNGSWMTRGAQPPVRDTRCP